VGFGLAGVDFAASGDSGARLRAAGSDCAMPYSCQAVSALGRRGRPPMAAPLTALATLHIFVG
jgi:hypothetical protein